MPESPARRAGFSLIELVIVVVIIGIIVGIALVRLTSSAESSKEAALAMNLRTVRDAIGLYRAEHHGRPPYVDENGNLDTVGANFKKRLEGNTDDNGKVEAGGAFGPHLRKFPGNPFSGKTNVRIDATAPGDGSRGWHMHEVTGQFSADDSLEHVGL